MGAFQRKDRLWIYYTKKNGTANTKKKVCLEPSTIQIDYLDVGSTSATKKKSVKYGEKYSADVKNAKGEVIHKKGDVKNKSTMKTLKLNGESQTEYLLGYNTQITITFNLLKESELRGILRAFNQKRRGTVKFSADYTNVAGETKTTTFTKENLVLDKVLIAFYEPMNHCFCKAFFEIDDRSYTTSYLRNGVLYYENVSFTFTTRTPRRPRSIWKAKGNGHYWWQLTEDTTISGKKYKAGTWFANQAPKVHNGYY